MFWDKVWLLFVWGLAAEIAVCMLVVTGMILAIIMGFLGHTFSR